MHQENKMIPRKNVSVAAVITVLIVVGVFILSQFLAGDTEREMARKGIYGGVYYKVLTDSAHRFVVFSWILLGIGLVYAGFLQLQKWRKLRGTETTNLTVIISILFVGLIVAVLLIIRQ
jgi:sterol desaturase/sphingolipid hydroxylase (fatty acid hydroxylase superfamily)